MDLGITGLVITRKHPVVEILKNERQTRLLSPSLSFPGGNDEDVLSFSDEFVKKGGCLGLLLFVAVRKFLGCLQYGWRLSSKMFLCVSPGNKI